MRASTARVITRVPGTCPERVLTVIAKVEAHVMNAEHHFEAGVESVAGAPGAPHEGVGVHLVTLRDVARIIHEKNIIVIVVREAQVAVGTDDRVRVAARAVFPRVHREERRRALLEGAICSCHDDARVLGERILALHVKLQAAPTERDLH